MSLPQWPGFCFDRNLGKINRPKIQTLDRIRGTAYAYYNDKLLKPKVTNYGHLPHESRGAKGPSWVVYDKKALCFDGYWLDELMEEPDKRYNCRTCKVIFYLEDNTIQVIEPRIRNSRLCQGTVVQRRQVSKPPPNDNTFYNVFDLNIGVVLQLHGKYIKLTSCDPFTHNFLRRLGIYVNNPIQAPTDPIDSLKSKLLAPQKKGKGFYKNIDTRRQFLENSRFILRFYCFWNNTDTFNDPRSMTLHYFLEDDTIEIIENFQPNCGRTGKVFFKRQRLPKYSNTGSLNFPSDSSGPSYLNVIKTRHKQHKLMDSLNMDDSCVIYYKDSDLSLGQYINVYGRKFLLCDCDEFTKEFYRKKYGISVFQSIDIYQYWPKGINVEKFIAPYDGWGTEEDSLSNCLSIRPTEIIKSNKKFINSKKTIDDLLFLNFLAKIDKPSTKYDSDRRFLISYCTETDTFLIMEKIDGKKNLFMNRDKHMKPKEMWKDTYIPEYYDSIDFYLGAKLHVKGLLLVIYTTDDYSLTYMEKNCHKFVYSSIERILTKLRKHLMNSKNDIEYFFKNEDASDSGFVNFSDFQIFKTYFADDIINLQELVTLARKYSCKNCQPEIESMKLIAKIRDTLRKNNFIDFYIIKERWYSESPQSTLISSSDARSVLKGLKIPLSDDMLCDLIKLSTQEADQVDLCTVLDIVNWQKFQPDYYNYVGKYLECEEDKEKLSEFDELELSTERHLKIGQIEWKLFVKDILHHPKISKSHPSTQKMISFGVCIDE